MRFSEIYNYVIPYWGDAIEFDDGELDEPASDEPTEYFFSHRFSTLWNDVEREVGYGNSFYELMVWTMYQVFHRHARERFRDGIFQFSPKDIDPMEIEEQYFNNLQDKIWAKERAAYERE